MRYNGVKGGVSHSWGSSITMRALPRGMGAL